MTYSDKLKDPRWQKLRLMVFERDNFECAICFDDSTELHAHHIKYCSNPWESKLCDLVTTCSKCHKMIEELKKKVSALAADRCILTGMETALVFLEVERERGWAILDFFLSNPDKFEKYYNEIF